MLWMVSPHQGGFPMDIDEVFNEVAEKMRSDLKQARGALSHAGMKGASAEDTFRAFLRDYLPRSLDVSSGVLVDANGTVSRQLDVIISDAAKTPVFFRSGENRVIPVECAYAVIEVKSKLDANELASAFRNMLSVRALNKTAYYEENSVIVHTKDLYGQKWKIWPTNFFVFAFDSTDLARLRDKLEALHLEASLPEWSRVDCVGVLDRGVIYNHIPQDDDFSVSALPEPGSQLMYLRTERPLLFFYSLISHFLNQADMPNFRFNDYLGEITF